MKRLLLTILVALSLMPALCQSRRPVDSQHPLWFIHCDVWVNQDPQKFIDLIPADIRPYLCINLSLSCQYDKDLNVYKMPQDAVRSYQSWASVCQKNGMWFTCQPASGGHTHIQDEDMATFEYFFKHYPNFLGWNYAEQFWGFDEAGDKSSSPQTTRIALFAKLVEMSHRYGGMLIVSFCGNQWSYALSPVGMLKRNADLLAASKKYPEAILWLLKYTSSGCSYNTESACFGPFVEGLAKNFGTRYDWCGFTGACEHIYGKDKVQVATAAGIGIVMEQTAINGGAVWDGPELTWSGEQGDFLENSVTTVDGYNHRSWRYTKPFKYAWIDMFRKFIDGSIYISTRDEVVAQQKFGVLLDQNSGNDEAKFASWPSLYDGLYKQTDPLNVGNGQLGNNMCYFKSTGRYRAIPLLVESGANVATAVKKSQNASVWPSIAAKTAAFNTAYPQVSTGTAFVARYKNQIIAYSPFNNVSTVSRTWADIPLQYNTCSELRLRYAKLSNGAFRETANKITGYLNNLRVDSTGNRPDSIIVTGCKVKPTCKWTMHEGTTSYTPTTTYADGVFTLVVKHCGPVDIEINCEGDATDRRTDYLPTAALPTPQQPAPWQGEVFVEAEDMDFKGLTTNVDWTKKQGVMTSPYNTADGAYRGVRGHAGNGFVIFDTGASLRHKFTVPQAGTYTIDVRYMAKDAAGTITAQAGSTTQKLALAKTADNDWQHARFDAVLAAGENILQLNNAAAAVYIDQCSYAPQGTEPMKYDIVVTQKEGGTVTFDKTTAAPGESVTWTVTPDDGYQLVGWNIVRGDVDMSANTFAMPDDNVTLEPIYKSTAEVNLVYHLDYSNVGAGSIPAGWEMASDSEMRHCDQTYGGGSRTMAGFNGFQGKATYWRNGYAQIGYGFVDGDPTLDLEPGDYTLTYAVAAWKNTPKYYVTVLNTNEDVIAQGDTYVAAPNAGGSDHADISAAEVRTLDFTITEEDTYAVRFNRQEVGYDEYLLLQCDISRKPSTSAIDAVVAAGAHGTPTYYDAEGRQTGALTRGLNIIRYKDGTAKKVFLN